MKTFLRCISLTLMMCFLAVGCFSLTASADVHGGKLTLTSARGSDNTVEVTITMSENPGFVSANLYVNFDTSVLQLTKVKDGNTLTGPYHSDKYTSPYALCWIDDLALENHYNNGTLVTLTFKVLDASKLTDTKITLRQDIVNFDLENVWFEVKGGTLTLADSGKSEKADSSQASVDEQSDNASQNSDNNNHNNSDSNLLSSGSNSPSLSGNEGVEAVTQKDSGESEYTTSYDEFVENGDKGADKAQASQSNPATADAAKGNFPIWLPITLGAAVIIGGAAVFFFKKKSMKNSDEKKK